MYVYLWNLCEIDNITVKKKEKKLEENHCQLIKIATIP